MQPANSVQTIQPSYIREILHAATSPDTISLAGGLPSEAHFPLDLMQDYFQSLTKQTQFFQYGTTLGYPELLAFFEQADWTEQSHHHMVCNGSQQGLDLIARSFINHGDQIVMETPSYLGAIQVFGLAGAKLQGVNQTHTGPDLNQLASIFAQNKTKIFYAVPDFHNPTGVCWSLSTRKAVADLCRKHHVCLVEDSPYRSLRFSGTPLPTVTSFCPDIAFNLTSFSKIASPGMRLGLVSGPKNWIRALEKVKQAADLHTNLPMQGALLTLLQHPKFSHHLQNLCTAYGKKHHHLTQLIDQTLPSNFQYRQVNGGMFLWLTIDKFNPRTLANEALKQGVAVVPSDVFYLGQTQMPAALRLNFTHASLEQLKIAVHRIRLAITKVS